MHLRTTDMPRQCRFGKIVDFCDDHRHLGKLKKKVKNWKRFFIYFFELYETLPIYVFFDGGQSGRLFFFRAYSSHVFWWLIGLKKISKNRSHVFWWLAFGQPRTLLAGLRPATCFAGSPNRVFAVASPPARTDASQIFFWLAKHFWLLHSQSAIFRLAFCWKKSLPPAKKVRKRFRELFCSPFLHKDMHKKQKT